MNLRRLGAWLLPAFAAPAFAGGYMALGTTGYDDILDVAPSRVEIVSYDAAFDCNAPPVVARGEHRLDISLAAIAGAAADTPCFGHAAIDVGKLSAGRWTVAVHVAAGGVDRDVLADEFRVLHYGRSCNRVPRGGSIVNVYIAGMSGTAIAAELADRPDVLAALGHPRTSPTLYRDSGLQLVYPAPEDPQVRRDAAVATGLFDLVGIQRPLYTYGVPPPDALADAVEFHHRALDAYFYATDVDEIAALDKGAAGWKRTGASFRVVTDTVQETGQRPLYEAYRFYGAAGGPTTHVFTIDQEECFTVQQSGVWQYEGVAFLARAPLADGSCRFAERPLYRVWRPFGESRHRFTVEPAIVDDMARQGWVDEGPVMCVAG